MCLGIGPQNVCVLEWGTVMGELPLFELEQVYFAPTGRDLVANVTWRVGNGERWAVLGPNGCGKSTLLQLAIGTLWPTQGVIRRPVSYTHLRAHET